MNNSFSFKSLLLPVAIIGLVGGAVLVGVLLSKSSGNEPTGVIMGAAIEESDNRMGNPEATVELVEYADFQCPACASYDPIVRQLMAEHGDWINFAYRHFPLKEIHPNAVPAARASEAALKQGKFFEYKEVLYTNQKEWASLVDASGAFLKYARSLGLDEEQFIRDMDSAEVRNKVESQYQTAVSAGMNSTPSFLVNGKKISNPGTYEQFVELLQAARQQ